MKRKYKPWKPKKPYATLCARSRRIEVRPYRDNEFEAWRAGHAGRSPKRTRFDGKKPKPSELTLARFRQLQRRGREKATKLHGFSFGIFERETGRVLGHIGFNLINVEFGWANLGYGIHNQHWGRGYGPEAARLCLALGFGPLNLFRIEASCDPKNKPSAKTALRAGLRPEGLRRKFPIIGEVLDLTVFGENQIDWRRKQRAR